MKTIILTGSPKPDAKTSNSQIFADTFVSKMKDPCEIKRIVKEDPKELAQYVKAFDNIIIIMPLYIHAMPGIVMRFFECLEPASDDGKSIGFIIQAGFMETSQERYVERYVGDLAKQLNYRYLGTVSKGQAAATYMFPKMFKKALESVAALGEDFESTNSFDEDITKSLGEPYEITKSQLRILNFMDKLGLSNIFWHREMKKNGAFAKRLDKPYLNC